MRNATIIIIIWSLLLISCGKDNSITPQNSSPNITNFQISPNDIFTDTAISITAKVIDKDNNINNVILEYGLIDKEFAFIEMENLEDNYHCELNNLIQGQYQFILRATDDDGLETIQSLTKLIIQKFNIINLSIIENIFSCTTDVPINVSFSYKNNFSEYEGFSTTEMKTFHQFLLPTDDSNEEYTLSISLSGQTYSIDRTENFTSFTNTFDDFLRIDIVDVCQGDGILIRTPDHHNIAIDGGYGTHEPSWGAPGGSDDGSWDGDGEPIMLNYVLENEVTSFSYLIETHPHSDHWGGLQDILDNGIPVENYIDSNDESYDGSTIEIGENIFLEFLSVGYPPNVPHINANNLSIVNKLIYNETEILFTGDAESEVENYLLTSHKNISADALKIGHHGSHTSSIAGFLSTVFDQYCKVGFISFGEENPYGHPHDLQRFENYTIYTTNDFSENYGDFVKKDIGNILIFTDGNAIIIKTR